MNQQCPRSGSIHTLIQQRQLKEVRRSREENKNSPPTVAEFSEAADLLNQLKTRRKKSGANLADMEAVLDILENH